MHKSEIHLHYAYIRAQGKDFRILTTNFPKLEPGHATSDFLGFFGLGSGEFWTTRPPEFEGVTCTPVEISDTETELLAWTANPRFMGFLDLSPDQRPMVLLSGGETLVYELPINWEVYTQLGVQSFALDTLGAFRRAHIAYPTPEENYDRVTQFMRYVRMF